MKWKAYVEGDRFDLDTAKQLFPEDGSGFVRFAEDANGVYVSSDQLDGISDQGSLQKVSAHLIERINASARVVDSSFRPLTLTNRFEDTEGNATVVLGRAAFEGRGRLTAKGVVVSGGRPEPAPTPPAPRFVELAFKDPTAAEAMAILGVAGALGWSDLYKVFEIIAHDLGGLDALVKTGWTSRTQAGNFTLSANRKDVSGGGARHAPQ